jgi:replicative DNA helicase
MQDNLQVLDNAFNGIVSGLPLPWKKFSDNVSGLQRASVIPFVGRDGKGKSGALCQMLDFWAGEEIPAISFSMEDVARRTVLRMAGCRKWFSARSVESGKTLDMNGRWQTMVGHEKDKLERQLSSYGEWLQKRPFWIDDNKYTVEELCAKIRHYHRVHGIQVATIDGFKDIVHSKGDNDTACEKHIAQELFKVAKDLNIAIPVVSHITKIDDGIPIRKENIKGSGTQFQGARQVFIFQDAGIPEIIDEHHFILACTKNNYGSGGSAVLRRDVNVLKYQEL